MFFIYSPFMSAKHRCNSNSHHNPVSCPLNTGQVHTPRSCSATEITRPHRHAHICPRPKRSQLNTMRDSNRFKNERKCFIFLNQVKRVKHTHHLAKWMSKSHFPLLVKLFFAVKLCSLTAIKESCHLKLHPGHRSRLCGPLSPSGCM